MKQKEAKHTNKLKGIYAHCVEKKLGGGEIAFGFIICEVGTKQFIIIKDQYCSRKSHYRLQLHLGGLNPSWNTINWHD